ncbi:putative alpha-galactosidase A [Fusarium sp. NRRL 52700]|nr:putative alpha-galactosidase A [Fusarium sp. NRRL 52700]
MKVIEYDLLSSGNFAIVLETSKARQIIPIVNTIPRPPSEVGDDEDQTAEESDIKREDYVRDEMPSDSVVARSVIEPEAESDPRPVSEDGEVGSVRLWNRLFFGKKDPQESEKKGFRLKVKVQKEQLKFFCGPRFLRPAVGSVLEASDYGWDAVALGITVSAIHGQYRFLPVKIDLELFVKIAIIADYMG